MPKVKTSRTKEPPEGYDEIEEVVRGGPVLSECSRLNLAEPLCTLVSHSLPFSLYNLPARLSAVYWDVFLRSRSSKNTNAR